MRARVSPTLSAWNQTSGPRGRSALARLFSLVIALFYRQRVYDTTSGLKVLARPVFGRLISRPFVDFHAELTSEKVAMGWHLDGKVTAVVGTHTHVQTADERVLPKGTAYLTDVGMTGPHDSIIGVEIEPALNRFLTALPSRFETATLNPRLNAFTTLVPEDVVRAQAHAADIVEGEKTAGP